MNLHIDRLADLKPRQIDMLAAAVMVVASAGLFMPRINPLLRSGDFAQQQQAQLAVALRNEKDLNSFLVDQRARLGEIRAGLQKEKTKLESARNINQRIASLTRLAAGTGLSVNEILPGATVAGERFDSVPVQMNASGSYPTCVAFLGKLTETFPDTSVGSFELAGDPQKPGTPAVFQVNLVWHAKAENGEKPGPRK